MIPIPVVQTHYTVTACGRVLKLVPCENCSTEYVYVLEREGEGAGTSFYFLNEGGAHDHAVSAAEETLREYLENDFDPVPCPVCGHYQKYMFPKLMTRSVWVAIAIAAVLMISCLSAVTAVYWGIRYAQRPDDHLLWKLGVACAVFVVAGAVGVGLSALERARVRRFDPNTEDQQARIAKGKSRALTRTEFEAAQRPTT